MRSKLTQQIGWTNSKEIRKNIFDQCQKKLDLTEARTRAKGFRVLCACHYTIEPFANFFCFFILYNCFFFLSFKRRLIFCCNNT